MKHVRKKIISIIMMVMLGSSTISFALAEEGFIHQEVGFLIVAPDRGFLGNEEVRDLYDDFSKTYTAALSFATSQRTGENLSSGITQLKAQGVGRIWVLPLFVSPGNILYQRAVKALREQTWGLPLRVGETMHKSYLTEELLKARIDTLSKTPSKEVLVVIGYGASDPAGEKAIREDLEALVEKVDRFFRFRATEVQVLYDWAAEEADREAAFERIVDRVALNRVKGERVVVVPFNFGRKLTNMMASWNRLKRVLSNYDKVVSNGEGILPHKNVGIWLRKEANRRLPFSDDEIGVVLMPHGSDFNWNETIRRDLSSLNESHMIEYAFSMADPKVIERAVEKLEDRGARAIVVVRIFSLAASFREKTEFILGLNDHYRRGGRTMRIASPSLLATVGGTERDSLLAQVLLERAKALSEHPEKETVILLAHGTDSEERNQHWLENLAALADEMRRNGGAKFRDIRYETWREDWPDKREEAVLRIRKMIEEASQAGGTAIIVPERTAGRGHGEKYFKGLSYRYATGFSPHPNFLKWVEGQIEAGKSRLRAKVEEANETGDILVKSPDPLRSATLSERRAENP
ncbi:MAG: sirohydrochlorin chelatase [Nitrospiria bacterium]